MFAQGVSEVWALAGYVSAKDCKGMSRFKLFYKLKPRLGYSNVSKDKLVNSKAREEISQVERIWTYKIMPIVMAILEVT